MKLIQVIHTKNDCYKANRKITVKGLMIHSTGANNPYLKRYVGTHTQLGTNSNNNDWNRSGITKCVHGFIGYGLNKEVMTVQTLPWDHRGWHGGGKANDTHIGVEICEDGLIDKTYFDKVYKEAVELFAMLCKEYKLNPLIDVIDHATGYKLGIASNHADIGHWFPKHGKSLATFRNDILKEMNKTLKSNEEITKEVIAGKWGNNPKRKEDLIKAGYDYAIIQAMVNEMLKPIEPPKEDKPKEEIIPEEPKKEVKAEVKEEMEKPIEEISKEEIKEKNIFVKLLKQVIELIVKILKK